MIEKYILTFIGIYLCCNLLFMKYIYDNYLIAQKKPTKKTLYSMLIYSFFFGSLFLLYFLFKTHPDNNR